MNRTGKSLAATFLSAAMLFSSAGQAMEIRQFDKMADQDQAKYRRDLVVGRAGSRDPSHGLWVDGRHNWSNHDARAGVTQADGEI